MTRRVAIGRLAVPLAAAAMLASLCLPAAGQAPSPLHVAVYDAAPYGTVAPDGSISGLSVDLWRRVAERMERPFDLTSVADMATLLDGVRQGRFDVAIGAITITPERDKLVDFSYPAHRSGVAVAMRKQGGQMFVLKAYFAALLELVSLLALIVTGLIATGLVMWRIERSGMMAGQESHVTTLRDGLYWAVVTMTTVGYGDKTPKTNAGRILATVWMFASLVLISLLSTSLVSKLTADRVEGGDTATSIDLAHQSLAAAAGSSGAEYLEAQRLPYFKTKDLGEALDRLQSGRATAVVNSVGTLKYAVAKSYARDLQVPQGLLATAYMAFALHPGSTLRREIDESLIKITGSGDWTNTEERFFAR